MKHQQRGGGPPSVAGQHQSAKRSAGAAGARLLPRSQLRPHPPPARAPTRPGALREVPAASSGSGHLHRPLAQSADHPRHGDTGPRERHLSAARDDLVLAGRGPQVIHVMRSDGLRYEVYRRAVLGRPPFWARRIMELIVEELPSVPLDIVPGGQCRWVAGAGDPLAAGQGHLVQQDRLAAHRLLAHGRWSGAR